MKIKVFKFEVSNGSCAEFEGDSRERWFQIAKSKLVSPETIERTINNFCCDKNIINISINNVDVKYHNNARGNTIELWYTIMYNED